LKPVGIADLIAFTPSDAIPHKQLSLDQSSGQLKDAVRDKLNLIRIVDQYSQGKIVFGYKIFQRLQMT